jgi:dethiobiotin synthetase
LRVVLVVGIRLGCLSQAALSAAAIAARSLQFAGWIANCVDPNMTHRDANIDTLQQRFARGYQAPLIGVIPFLGEPTAAHAAPCLQVSLQKQR